MEMFSMIKHSLATVGNNPISKYYQLGRQMGSAGPEMVWKVFDAKRLADGRDASVFLFDKKIADKLHKPRRREIVSEILRKEVKQLTRMKHPRILKVYHEVEECHDSLAFATEPVFASLANVLGNYERITPPIPPDLKDYEFLEFEIKYGLLQIGEALLYLHDKEHMVHGNVCPNSIMITKRKTWKLAGLGFLEKCVDNKGDKYKLSAWTTKTPKMAQPDLDFIAPEVQMDPGKDVFTVVDMYSLGMTICAIYNNGKSLIHANHNPSVYAKRVEQMTDLFGDIAHRMPLQLVEPVEKMINRDVRYRPNAQLFMILRYLDDPVVKCLQKIDILDAKELTFKCEFFSKLANVIPQIPRKVLYECVFPVLCDQLEYQDMLVLALPSLITMVQHSSADDYTHLIQPQFKKVFTASRPVPATVYLLENLDVLLGKASEEDVKTDILPMIFTTLESNSIQGQEAAINVFSIIKKYLDDQTMRKLVLPKAKSLFLKSTNIRVRVNALACIDKLLDSLDKMMILDEVLPFLTEIQTQDVDIIMAVTSIYGHMLSDRKFGLTSNLLATKVMPTLIPYSNSPGLTLDQFTQLMDVLRDMLEQIDRQRRNKMMDEAVDLTNTGAYTRRKSIDMRYSVYDPPKQEQGVGGPKFLLSVDEYPSRCRRKSSSDLHPRLLQFNSPNMATNYYKTHRASLNSEDGSYPTIQPHHLTVYPYGSPYGRRHSYTRYNWYRQAPSTPELQTQRSSQDSLCSSTRTYRRHSSFQGLGMEEQAVLEKIVKETQRRGSLVPPQPCNPAILVSEPSVTNFEEPFFYGGSPRRASTQSMGPVVVPEPGRRDSRGRLLDSLPNSNQRRSSFQGICESAMQFFGGK